ncbi:MAG TPA: hypothetical protein PKH69_11860 [Thiobacillaceae bacterium]|nr:hypothetical protein [Thiobacillaceae bacterium]HNU65165.1 hypothetical protein [Thiobacillaceae bacterium]
MRDPIQVSIDADIYEQLKLLMVPPIHDINGVIRALLIHDGRHSEAAIALEADNRHYSYAQELERSMRGVYDGGGGT